MAAWDEGRFGKAVKWVSDQLALVSCMFTLIMVFAVMREVVGRYFFNSPAHWSEETQTYLLVGMVYMSLAYTETEEVHIRIDMIYNLFRGKPKIIMDILIYLIAICWTGVLCWQGWKLALRSIESGTRSAQAMMWPLWPSQIMIPIGTLILLMVLACKLSISVSLLFNRRQ